MIKALLLLGSSYTDSLIYSEKLAPTSCTAATVLAGTVTPLHHRGSPLQLSHLQQQTKQQQCHVQPNTASTTTGGSSSISSTSSTTAVAPDGRICASANGLNVRAQRNEPIRTNENFPFCCCASRPKQQHPCNCLSQQCCDAMLPPPTACCNNGMFIYFDYVHIYSFTI